MVPTALVPPVIAPAVITPVVTPAVPLVVAPPTVVTPPIVLPPFIPAPTLSTADIAALIASAMQAQSVSQNQLIMDTLKQQGREIDKRMESQFKIITDSLKVVPTPSTSQEVLDELDGLHAKRQLVLRDYGIMTPAQRTSAKIDQHLAGMDTEEAKLRDAYVALSNQERKDARALQTTKTTTKRARGPGASPVQPTPKKKNKGNSSSVPVVIDSDDQTTSDAEAGAGDGSLLPKQNSTPTKDNTIRFDDSDHILSSIMEVYNKEAAGAPVWGKDSTDLPFRREGKTNHAMISTMIEFANKAHKLQDKGIRSILLDPEGSRIDILASQSMYEQMIGELLARTARSQMVRQLAVNLGWEQAENAETLAPTIHAKTPSNFSVFLSGAADPVLKIATKRSNLVAGQLGKPPVDNSYHTSNTSPQSGRGSQSSGQQKPPMCKTCHKAHLPPCRLACLKCSGNQPPLQKGHAEACRT